MYLDWLLLINQNFYFKPSNQLINSFKKLLCFTCVLCFILSDSKEFDSWIDSINFACARFSSPGLPKIDGNHKKFQRPLLPSAPTNFNLV